MTDGNICFRLASMDETHVINSFLLTNFNQTIEDLFSESSFWVKEGNIKEVFILSIEKTDLLAKIPVPIYSAGVPFGSLWGQKFQLEIEGSALLLPHIEKIIHVKTDQFLYGKPIFAANVVKKGNFAKDDWVVIIGKNSLHYGLGTSLFSSVDIPKLDSNAIVVKGNKMKPFDRGWYLRKGR